MMFGQYGNPDRDECVRIVHSALDGGINTIDTADVHSGEGDAERIVGRALRGRRDAVEALAVPADEAGLSLPHLALGFVTAHPAVTSAIIGPRTPEQPAALLEGTDLGPIDVAYTPPQLEQPALRRR